MKKYFVFFVIVLCTLLLLCFFRRNSYEKNYFYLDTYINVKVNSNKSKKSIDKIFDDIDDIYSTYHKLSDKYNSYDDIINVYYLNNILENGAYIDIPEELSELISLGIRYYDITSGYINIASSNLIDVWKDYIEKGEGVPSSLELDVNIDINSISLDGNTYSKSNDVTIDLGSYVKGYVTQVVGDYLEECGIYDYLIDAGGNIKVGTKYNGKNYVVGIIDPISVNSVFTTLSVNNNSVVTSGDYQRYYEYNDVRYSHIIDPYTRYPASIYRSVTVICNDSFKADIYSTYLFLIDIDEGLRIVNSDKDISAIWYIDKDNIVKSDNFNY